MPDPNDPNQTTPPTPPDDGDEAKRGRGRPTIAEIEAREASIAEREAGLAARQADLDAAMANMEMRMREMERFAAARPQSVRGSIRDEDIREPIRQQRRYRSGEMPNEFHLAKEDIPPGVSYQWNNHTIFGQHNHSYDAYMRMQGWTPVHSSRHPHLCEPGYDGPIVVKGQILMERPEYLTQEAIQEDYERAIGEVQAKEAQLYGAPAGTLPRARANGSNDFIQVNRDVERGAPHQPTYQYPTEAGGAVIE